MLIVLLIIAIIIMLKLANSYYDEFMMFTVIVILVIIAGMLFCINGIANDRVIDDKIEMYIEENTKIEESISKAVIGYMKFESDTFKDLKNESAITLVNLYPELKSDELIKTQIEVYQENNAKIKELKEQKINISVVKWWLYFGK